jgi:hypothetical protein
VSGRTNDKKRTGSVNKKEGRARTGFMGNLPCKIGTQ